MKQAVYSTLMVIVVAALLMPIPAVAGGSHGGTSAYGNSLRQRRVCNFQGCFVRRRRTQRRFHILYGNRWVSTPWMNSGQLYYPSFYGMGSYYPPVYPYGFSAGYFGRGYGYGYGSGFVGF